MAASRPAWYWVARPRTTAELSRHPDSAVDAFQEEGKQQVVDRKGMCQRQLQMFVSRLAQLTGRPEQPSGGAEQPVRQAAGRPVDTSARCYQCPWVVPPPAIRASRTSIESWQGRAMPAVRQLVRSGGNASPLAACNSEVIWGASAQLGGATMTQSAPWQASLQ